MTSTSSISIDRVAEQLGVDGLRPPQRNAIEALVDGVDVLAIIPTGGGKSAIYQGAALVLGGVTVVVSPLLALQDDQIRSIEDSEVGRAVAVDGSTSDIGREAAFEALESGTARFLFVTPEILASDEVLDRLARCHVKLFAVDEAHCIVTWGQGFRPDFLLLGDARRRLGDPTVVALTGSADPRIRADIRRSLSMTDGMTVTSDLERANIELSVVNAADRAAAADRLAEHLDAVPGKALVYVPTRRLCSELAERIHRVDRPATPYHGGLNKADKEAAVELIRSHGQAVVVATTAFGMGIDIPDISAVAHLDMPDSLLAYYQEVGRGGRDGSAASGAVFVSLRSRSRRAFGSGVRQTTVADCATVYVEVQNGATSRRQLIDRLPLNAGRIVRALGVLEQVGAIATSPHLTVTGEVDADRVDDVCREREEFDRSQIEAVERYRSVRRCRWGQILTSLGEPLDECGHCDVCADVDLEPPAPVDDADLPFPVGAPVEHAEFGPGTVTSRLSDIITVSFESVGPKDLATELCLDGGLLR